MPTERRFKNSWSRLERATHHLLAFQTQWRTVLNKESFGTIVNEDESSGWFTARMFPHDESAFTKAAGVLPLIVGEYAYQLRAALDGLMWDAITFKQGTEPPSDASSIDFPILNGKVRNFDKCGFKKFPFPDNLAVWLESIQPGTAEKPLDHPDRGLANTLESIHDLARFDRHRRLRLVAAYPTQLYAGIKFVPPGDFVAVAKEGLTSNILGGEYELFRFKVQSPSGHRPQKITIGTNALIEVFFEDIAPFEDLSMGETLGALGEAVEYVISRFEDEFAI